MYNNTKSKTVNVQGSHSSNHNVSSQPPAQTYAQATSNTPIYNNVPPASEAQAPDVNKLMSKFLDEFKTLINPLIALLTKVVVHLLDKPN